MSKLTSRTWLAAETVKGDSLTSWLSSMITSQANVASSEEFSAKLEAIRMLWQLPSQNPVSNGHPSLNGSARSTTTFVKDNPVHQAPAAADFAGMALLNAELHDLEAGDCMESLIPMSSLLDGDADDGRHPLNFQHLMDYAPRKFESAFEDSPASSASIPEQICIGPMQVNLASNVAADGHPSPYEQFLYWHEEHDGEEDAEVETLITQISYFADLQQQVHAPQMGQVQTCLPPPASDSAPLENTSAQGAMATMCRRDSHSPEISDTRCQMMDTRGMPSHDGNCMQRIGSMVAEDDFQVVHADGRGSSMERNYSFMMEVPTLAGHAGLGMTSDFRNGSLDETQTRYMVMESDKGSEDREFHDHAANAQRQVSVTGRKTKNVQITKADFEAVYHLPMKKADERLNLGSTRMKDLCRDFKIERWPYRKLSSLDSLMRDVDAEMEGDEWDPDHQGQVIKKMIIKLKAEIMTEPNTPIDQLLLNLRQVNFKNKYKRKLSKTYKTGK
eukprot:gene5220-18448_t